MDRRRDRDGEVARAYGGGGAARATRSDGVDFPNARSGFMGRMARRKGSADGERAHGSSGEEAWGRRIWL